MVSIILFLTNHVTYWADKQYRTFTVGSQLLYGVFSDIAIRVCGLWLFLFQSLLK